MLLYCCLVFINRLFPKNQHLQLPCFWLKTNLSELCLYLFRTLLKLNNFHLCELVALILCHTADVIQALILPRLSSNAHSLFAWELDDNNILPCSLSYPHCIFRQNCTEVLCRTRVSSHQYSVKEKKLCEFILIENWYPQESYCSQNGRRFIFSYSRTEPELEKPHCYIKGCS